MLSVFWKSFFLTQKNPTALKQIIVTLLGVMVYCIVAYASVLQKQFIVQFPTDGSSLDAAATAELDHVISFAKSGKYFEITLDAHTDNEGADQYNVVLSKNRAISVVEYLVSQGLEQKRIQFNWFGEAKPLKSNATKEGKQQNRRVAIIVNIYDWNSAADLLGDVSDNKQEFSISPEKEATIETSGGIKMKIPENTFVTADGSPAKPGNIAIVVTEALSRESWLQENLSTIAPGGILESGGMLKIEAMQNGQPLSVREGKQIDMQLPFTSPSEGMSLFYASNDESGNMVWQQADEPVKIKRNVELPTLKADMRKLDALIDKYSKMRAPYVNMDSAFYMLPPKPNEFTLKPPRIPKEPKREDVRLYISKLRLFVTTRKQKDKLIETAYQKRMQAYEKKMERYNKYLENYQQKKERAFHAIEQYQAMRPYYDSQVIKAIAAVESIKNAFDQNIAYSQIHRCLADMKRKLTTQQITDPNYLSTLSGYHAYTVFTYDLRYPEELTAIKDKLATLGYTSSKNCYGDGWYARKKFYRIWAEDEELVSLLNESERNLMAERLSKGISSRNEMSGYYLTSLNSMGWMNIDKLVKLELTATLTIQQDPGSEVFVIFDDMNSVLKYTGETMKIPQNKPINVFSVMIKDNMPHYAIARVDGRQRKNLVALQYKEGLVNDIKSAIKEAV